MKTIKSSIITGILFIALFFYSCYKTSAQSVNQNYIRTRVFKAAQVADGGDTINKITTIQYFDGLSRLVQTVGLRASPTAKDFVQINEYDAFNRDAKLYLPYSDITGTPNMDYKTNATTAQLNFYSPSTTVNGVVRTSYPYSIAAFEASSENLVAELGFPGADWQVPENIPGDVNSSRHTRKNEYKLNNQIALNTTPAASNFGSQLVAKYDVSISNANDMARTLTRSATSPYYASGELFVSVVKDENWQPANGCVGWTEEYKDKSERLVLKRTYNKKGSPEQVEMISTYYIYDELGNLCFVLTPKSNPDAASGVPAADVMSSFCYQYIYDLRNRMIKKKLPGKDWEYFAYNPLNQLVLTQDGMQRSIVPQTASFTKYDAFGRTVMTGTVTLSSTYTSGQDASSDMRGNANSYVPFWESRMLAGTAGSSDYTSNSYPTTGFTPLIINYYDSYTGIPDKPSGYQPATFSKRTRGLLTASKTAVLNTTTNRLNTLKYYDEYGRIENVFKQHYLGGVVNASNYDQLTTTYNFTGNILNQTRNHYVYKSGVGTVLALTVINRNVYDHMLRNIEVWQRTGTATSPEILLSKVIYNERGEMSEKRLHTGTIQKLAFKYNERGWLTQINDPNSVTATQVFGMQLFYNSGTLAPQYNSNIAKQLWQTKIPSGTGMAQALQSYTYSYDMADRLKSAVYDAPGLTNKFNEEMTYDINGNIQSLKRKDNVSGFLNDFSYDYSLSGTGNQLWKVTDAGTAAQTSNYTYDLNGNTKTDSRNGITNTVHNILDLPQTIYRSAGNISYVYDAEGKKLRKTVGTTVKEYIDGVEYTNGVLGFLITAEGRAVRGTGDVYSYEYSIPDHLGNTRAVIKQDGSIMQLQDYYAFGLDIKNLNNSYNQTIPANLYKYNKRELQTETGKYDYGARYYDPLIGRFSNVDPLATSLYEISPYAFVRNNPALRVDKNGLWDITVHAYKDRTKYGFGIAVVTDRNGNEIYSFQVRLQGSGGSNRTVTNSDTPTGAYDIPNKDMWKSGGPRESYGPNPRLILTPESGEIVTSGRDAIRIHGGRQEVLNKKTGVWEPAKKPGLGKTHGCMRCYDNDIKTLKEVTDALMAKDKKEIGGKLTVVDDLVETDEKLPMIFLTGTKKVYKRPDEKSSDEEKDEWDKIIRLLLYLKNQNGKD